MILPQVAEKLTATEIQDSSPKTYSAFQEWVQGSGVSEDITKLNLLPLIDRAVIAMKLGWKKYLDNLPLGWWVSGLNLRTMELETFGQFKPNEPVKLSAKDKDAAKYLTSKGEYDAIALQHPDKDYWQRVIDDPSLPIALDEGVKKAGLLMTLGFVALALCGVTMGLKKGGKELVNNLAVLAVQGRPITIVFDSDLAVKSSIQLALKALATVLKQKGCILSVAIIPLELECKGIDDVWAKYGEEMVKKIMADAIPYSQWLKNLEAQMSDPATSEGNKKSNPKPPTPRETAALIAEEYGNQWKFDNEQKEWRVYSGKHWEKVEIGNFETLLMRVVDAKNIAYTGDAYLTDVLKLLTKLLREKHLGGVDRRRFINFSNCVLDGNSGTTREHQPADRFTSYLPFEHKPLKGDISNALQALEANCPNINTWMRTAMKGDAKKIFKLLAIINGCLRFRFHATDGENCWQGQYPALQP
jgi:putative DNA primase/helicase